MARYSIMRFVDFQFPPKVQQLQARLAAFMDAHIYPNEARFKTEIADGDRWQPTAIVETLKEQARADGLWNLFLPDSEYGAGLTNRGVRAALRDHGALAGLRARRCSTAPRPTPATWKCWSATARPSRSGSGSSRCSPARFAPASR